MLQEYCLLKHKRVLFTAKNTLSIVMFRTFFKTFLREWSNLTPEQAEYLVQVRGPHDMFQYIVRDLVTVTNVSNAAILFDDSFFMSDDHYTNLLIHMPVRHVINKVTFEVKFSCKMYRKSFIINCQALVQSPVPVDPIPILNPKKSQNKKSNWD